MPALFVCIKPGRQEGDKMELMLIENPISGRRGVRNMYGYYPNPRRRYRRRRNPAGPMAMQATVREWTQGVDMMDAVGAVGGLAAAATIPGIFVKDAVTNAQKISKLLVSFISAVAAGAVGRAMVSPSVGKAAIIGGLAGTATQAIGLFTTLKIGGRSIRETSLISPAPRRDNETISVIEP